MLTDLITADALGVLTVAALVGVVVGLTGMGGGALMTPGLILLGIPPTAAVANDLEAAVANKSFAAIAHWRQGAPNIRLALWLSAGSVTLSLIGPFLSTAERGIGEQQNYVLYAIAVALLLASMTYVARILLHLLRRTGTGSEEPHIRPIPTFIVGAVGGLMVE